MGLPKSPSCRYSQFSCSTGKFSRSHEDEHFQGEAKFEGKPQTNADAFDRCTLHNVAIWFIGNPTLLLTRMHKAFPFYNHVQMLGVPHPWSFPKYYWISYQLCHKYIAINFEHLDSNRGSLINISNSHTHSLMALTPYTQSASKAARSLRKAASDLKRTDQFVINNICCDGAHFEIGYTECVSFLT